MVRPCDGTGPSWAVDAVPPGGAVPRTFAVVVVGGAAVAVVCAWDAPDADVVALIRPVRPEEGESDLVRYHLSSVDVPSSHSLDKNWDHHPDSYSTASYS